MEFLTSNFPPLGVAHKKFADKWQELFAESDEINIAVGYASNDSLLYLRRLVELNTPRSLNVCLGMARFEGLAQSQYSAATGLHRYLKEQGSGQVLVCNDFKFHGKVQTFVKERKLIAGLLGSSNLSNIVPNEGLSRGNYEVDLLIDESALAGQLQDLMAGLLCEASAPIDEINNLKILKDSNFLMEGLFEAAVVPDFERDAIWAASTQDSFEIPIKTAGKSNLNVFFGEGRVNRQGFVKPRHWYEAEIIVGRGVQSSAPNYPQNKEFLAYTDDGYKFVLKTSGDYSKNLRSRDDLTVLGRWIKGRMELSGALVSGQPITDDVLAKYGRSSLTLTRVNRTEADPSENKVLDVWTLDFGFQK
jgi:hypothetical protein